MVVAVAVVVVGLERMGENCTERVRLILACCCGGDLGGTGGGIVEVEGEGEGEWEGGEWVVMLLWVCYVVRWDGMGWYRVRVWCGVMVRMEGKEMQVGNFVGTGGRKNSYGTTSHGWFPRDRLAMLGG